MVPVEVKAEFVRRLLAAGLPVVEATSFVHPKWVPQLADAERADDRGSATTGTRACPVLVPNERGLDRALELGCGHIAIFGSATETFAQRNLNRSLDEQFAMFEPTVTPGPRRRAATSAPTSRMCFGDPWEGAVPIEQVVEVGKRLFDLGASQLSLGDTIGVGTAGHVTALLAAFIDAGHGHRRRSRCTSTTPTARRSPTRYAALQHGITTFDASAGGLGGCPYAKSATGNLATEDLVWMLTASASRPAWTSTRWSPPAPGWPAGSAVPAPRAVVTALVRRVGHNRLP